MPTCRARSQREKKWGGGNAFLQKESFQKSHTTFPFPSYGPELSHLALCRSQGVWEILLPQYNWRPFIKEEGEEVVGISIKQPLPQLEGAANSGVTCMATYTCSYL